MTNDLRIADAPLLVDVSGEEKLPTGGYGNYSTTINQIADFTQLKWKLATEGYVNNEINVVTNKLNTHTQDKTNPHGVTKEQVGLGEVDNTADLDKPVSAYQRTAIDEKIAKTSIADNLTTNDSTKVLSAKQGKVLQDSKVNKTDVEVSLGLKADKSEVYTKSETLTLEREDQYVITESGRSQREKNADIPTTGDYIKSSDTLASMAENLGFIIFPCREYVISENTVITVPIYFLNGAYITLESGATLEIKNTVNSSKQWIFRGDGEYKLISTGIDSGESVRHVHVSWFGALGGSVVDATKYIQKACDAVGNNREAVIEFDINNYLISEQINTGRCTGILGQGTRKTVFLVVGQATFDTFVTIGEGCVFKGIQFETQDRKIKPSGCYIKSTHDNVKVIDVQAGHGNYGIQLLGDGCEVRNIRGSYGELLASDSFLVNIASGANAIVDDVKVYKTGYEPNSLVLIGGEAQTGTVATATITNIKSQGKAVLVKPKSGSSVARLIIDKIFGTSTTERDYLVCLDTNGGNIIETSVQGLNCTNQYNDVLLINHNGGQFVRNTFDDLTASHNTAKPTQTMIKYNYISGTASNLTFKAGCGVTNRPNIIDIDSLSKTTTDLYVAPELSRMNQPLSKVYSIAVNSSQIVHPNRLMSLALIELTYQFSSNRGFSNSIIRAFSSPTNNPITTDTNIEYLTDAQESSVTSGKIGFSVNTNGTITLFNKTTSVLNICVGINS